MWTLIIGIMVPFLGTSLGALCIVFMKKQWNMQASRGLNGFAAGVMVAASIWSLLIPALEQSSSYGVFAFMPPMMGFWLGILFLYFLAYFAKNVSVCERRCLWDNQRMCRAMMLVFAIVIHNIPEGMAVGVAYAGWRSGTAGITALGALTLSIGIAIQNFPEGAIVSMPLRAQGMRRRKAVVYGILSGIVEPIAAVITLLLAGVLRPAMPYLLSFAAGAMLYVVVQELIPDMAEGSGANRRILLFALGFSLMMGLDVALG
ncbi:MAG: ZIP family metal transporter [Eubacteriales bacterium]|nr:ZIP family metal transporter [Eubacteriales bacterium]